METWETYWLDQEKEDLPVPDTLASTLKHVLSMNFAFPAIYCAVKIMSTVPVTSCECERSISKLGIIKTDKRSTMLQERLNGLSLFSIHRDMALKIDKTIIDKFAHKHPRRMEMTSILERDTV